MSFRDTAERMFVTASAVSHQIKNLEQELGHRLFDRDGNSLTLTDVGQSLYEGVHPLIAELDEVAARHKNAIARSALRISVQPFFASELFVPRLAEFTAAHPEIDIQVDTSDQSTEKHPGNADASIRIFKAAPSGLESRFLFSLQLVPAGSKSFRDKMKIRAKKVMTDFPRIVHASRPKAWTQWQRSSGIQLPAETTSIRLDSMIAVARAAERGMGAALVPVKLGSTMFESGALVPLFDNELETDDAFYFASDPEGKNRKNVQVLRDWVITTFAEAR